MNSARYKIDLRVHLLSLERPWQFIMLTSLFVFISVQTIPGQHPEVAVVDSIYVQGRELFYDGDYDEAIEHLLLARDLFKQTDSVPPELSSSIYLRLGESYRRSRMHEPALAFLDTSLAISIEAYGEWHEYVADVYLEQSIVHSQMMNMKTADQLNEKALDIFRKVFGPKSDIVGIIYMNMALDAYKTDEFEKSESLYLQAKEIFKQTLQPDDENYNRIYNNMGMLYRKKKDYEKALDYALIALDYKLKNYEPDHPTVGKYYGNIALTLMAMDRYEEALPYLEQNIQIMRASVGETHPEYAAALSDKAEVLMMIDDPQLALATFEKCHRIIASRLGETHPYAVACLSGIAACQEQMGELESAIKTLERSNSLLERTDEVHFPDMYSNAIYLASLHKRLGNFERARKICDSLLNELLQRMKVNNSVGYITEYPLMKLMAYEERADILRHSASEDDVDALKLAWSDYNSALEVIGEIRRNVLSEESLFYIYEECTSLYDGAIAVASLLYKLTGDDQYFDAALKTSEDSKSSVLRRAMLDRTATVFGGIPDTVVAKLHNIEDQLYDLRDLSEAVTAATSPDTARLEATELTVKLSERRDSLISAIELEYPQYYSLKYSGSELNTNQLQRALDHEEKVLLSFYMSDSMCYSFYLSGAHKTLATFQLNKSEIEWIESLTGAGTPVSAEQFDFAVCDAISEKLLGPFEAQLAGSGINRLLISPHGLLSYLPFDMLRIGLSNTPVWLATSFAVSYTHSLSYIESLQPDNGYDVAYAGFAPVYDWETTDETMYAMRSEQSPLPATEEEVSYGARLFRGSAFIRRDATYEEFMQISRKAQILHLATHATVNPQAPLDSYLHFFEAPDEDDSMIARKLTMFEIYKARIPASLVILSACESGGGNLRAGEGPMSLARAFRYAGSESVAMNLWPANDGVSRDIIRIFLRKLADGMPKDLALQQAKKEYLENADPFFSHPFFWAGLSVYGDTEAISSALKYKWWIPGFALSFILIFGAWMWKRN